MFLRIFKAYSSYEKTLIVPKLLDKLPDLNKIIIQEIK